MAQRKYPWEAWFDEERFVIQRGVHYQISQSSMHQTIRNNASARGLRVHIEDLNDAFYIQVMGSTRDETVHPKAETTVTSKPKATLEEDVIPEARSTQNSKALPKGCGTSKNATDHNHNQNRTAKVRR